MADNVSIQIVADHTAEYLNDLKIRIPIALKACGVQAVGHTVSIITEKGIVDTGRLRNSITSQMDGDKTVEVGTAVEYAIYNELGTSKMAARPYLRPAIEDYKDEYQKIFEKVLKG